MRDTSYPNDQAELEKLGAARQDFEAWMTALDAAHRKLGSPYGEGDLWDTTGPSCWIEFFREGVLPAGALIEDLSNV